MTATSDSSPAPEASPAEPISGSGPAVEVSRRPTPVERIRLLWQYRELVGNLTRKELKVKYKNSVLGYLWSLLNPLMYLVVFSVVFNIIARTPVPYYGVFFLSGLLAWNLFSAALGSGTSSIVANAQLVTKVWFPREALVIASVFSALVHFAMQSTVLIAAMIVFRRAPDFAFLPVFLLAVAVVLLLATALAIGLSAINVYLRDTQHLLEVALLAWFWLSAIAWPYSLILDHWGGRGETLAAINPIIIIVVTFQRTLYNPDYSVPNEAAVLPPHDWSWYVSHLAIAGGVAIVLLYGALWLFSRLEDNFAEEI